MNVVLFTGHRIDSPDRKSPRFPAQAEPIARAAIAGVLTNEEAKGPVTGIAGGANGGDILFLEVCRELGIPYQMMIALPEKQFVPLSVDAPTGNWVERFESLSNESKPRVMADSEDSPDFWARNNLWLIDSALALAPEEFVLVALWDGQGGDGPGGTEDMVLTAQKHGARFIHLDTRKLFVAQGGNGV